MTSAILFEMLDSTREEIVEKMRTAIQNGRKKKLSKTDFEELAVILAGKIIHLNRAKADNEEAVKAICDAEIQMLEEGYPQTSLNSKYLPIYTRQIKEAIAQEKIKLTGLNSYPKQTANGIIQKHFALEYLTYPKAIQVALRGDTTRRNNERQDQQQLVDVDAFIEKARQLLESDDPGDVAIALCALTGRRHTEIVSSGSFEAAEHPYTLRFEGQLKDPTPGFEILTLIPAKELLPRLEQFRNSCSELEGLSYDAPPVRAFNTRVNGRVRTHFEKTGIVPIPLGFKTVSIHRLRGVYGAIAIHFFCPPTKNEHRFLQHYLGHLINSQNADAFNAAATQHYFHFVAARDGKILSVKGVKLPASGQAPLPDRVSDSQSEALDISISNELEAKSEPIKSVISETAQLNVQVLEAELQTLRAENLSLKQENATLKGDRQLLEQLRQIIAEELDRSQDTVIEDNRSEIRPAKTQKKKQQVRSNRSSNSSKNKSTPLRATLKAKGRAQERAAAIFRTIQQWNQVNPDRSFAITQGLLVKTFHINQKAANAFLEANADTLKKYHREINISTLRGHNRQAGRDVDKLKAFVDNTLRSTDK